MAPKKKSKKGASSSSSYDSHRFWSEEAQQIYDSSMTRPIIPERGFNLTIARGVIISELERRQWVEFAQVPSDAVISIVREFYANLRIRHDESQVLVRGKLVPFDSRTINTLYQMPSFDQDEYSAFLEAGVDYTEVIRTICVAGAVWKMSASGPTSLKKSDMGPNASAWTSFVLARILPSSHYYDVTKDKAALVYAILKGKSVDVGKLIYGSIMRAGAGLATVALPCPHTVTELCHQAGVTWAPDEPVLKAKAPIVAFFGAASYVPHRFLAAEEPPQDQLPPPPAAGRQRRGDTLRRLELEMQDQRRLLVEQRQVLDSLQYRTDYAMGFMMDFTSVLAQRFPPLGPDDPMFPQTPVWPPPYPPPQYPGPPPQAPPQHMDEDDGDDDGEH